MASAWAEAGELAGAVEADGIAGLRLAIERGQDLDHVLRDSRWAGWRAC
jgi:hypothetical protein